MQLKRKNNNNSYPTNQIHLKMLIFQVWKYAHIDNDESSDNDDYNNDDDERKNTHRNEMKRKI